MKAIVTDLSDTDRKAIVTGLSGVLANNTFLYLKTHNFHWNVTGPSFQPLHTLFEEQYTDLWTAGDEIAERIRALGHFVAASYLDFSKVACIGESEGHSPPPAQAMIRQLQTDHEQMARLIREQFPRTEEVQDQATIDLLTRRLLVHEKNVWMLRSFLEA